MEKADCGGQSYGRTHRRFAPKIKSQISNLKKKCNFRQLRCWLVAVITELVLIKKWGDYKIIGQTRDDAAGECFDKTARMLELPYPGGPQVAKQAENFKNTRLLSEWAAGRGRRRKKEAFNIKLPRPMIDSKDYDFSFPALKPPSFICCGI